MAQVTPAEIGALDPYYDNVLLLLPGDSRTVSRDAQSRLSGSDGNVVVEPILNKFGGSSLSFLGLLGSDCLRFAPTDEWAFGTGDFTVEGWVYLNDVNQDALFWSVGAYGFGTGFYGDIYLTGTTSLTIYFGAFNPGAVVICSYAANRAATVNRWVHLAFVRQSGVGKIYMDGVQVASGANTLNALTPQRVRVGSTNHLTALDDFSFNYALKGYIDDFRITKGVARYTGNFTPPTVEFPWLAPVNTLGFKAVPYGLGVATLSPVDAMDSAGVRPTPRFYATSSRVLFDGVGKIVGTVKNTPATPVARKVVLIDEASGKQARQTWSDAAGAYAFDNIEMGRRYTVLSYDHTETYRAVVADRVLPELMP